MNHAVPDNLLANVPRSLTSEWVGILAQSTQVRIERIVSTGHCSPDRFWYDQDEHEWVLVLQGMARVAFEDGRIVAMKPADHILIPAHCKHRVQWTTPDEPTVWLAVFYKADGASEHSPR